MAYHQLTSVVDLNLTEDMANYQLSRGFVSVGFYVNMESRRSIVHRHPFYEYILVRKGSPVYQANGSRFSLGPDEMLLIAPGVPHAMSCREGDTSYERTILQINAAFLDRVMGECGMTGRVRAIPLLYRVPAEGVQRWGIQAMLERIGNAVSIADAALREKLIECQVMELLLILEHIGQTFRAETPHPASALVANVTAYMQAHFRDPELTVAGIADTAYVSREHLSRVFRKYTGGSVSHYLTGLRMMEFRSGLLEGKSIRNACMESGFSDYSSFVKSFRKLYGVTPMEYRDQLRGALGSIPG